MSKKEINNILDIFEKSGSEVGGFLYFNDGYHRFFDSRLLVFSDDGDNWCLVFEKIGYHNRGLCLTVKYSIYGKVDGVEIDINNEDGFLLGRNDFEKLESDFERLVPGTELEFNETRFIVPSIEELRKFGKVELTHEEVEDGLVDLQSALYYIIDQNKFMFRPKLNFYKEKLDTEIEFILEIEQWHHEPYAYFDGQFQGISPKNYETYPMIAEVITSRDPSLWKPTLEPNNFPQNWQNGDL